MTNPLTNLSYEKWGTNPPTDASYNTGVLDYEAARAVQLEPSSQLLASKVVSKKVAKPLIGQHFVSGTILSSILPLLNIKSSHGINISCVDFCPRYFSEGDVPEYRGCSSGDFPPRHSPHRAPAHGGAWEQRSGERWHRLREWMATHLRVRWVPCRQSRALCGSKDRTGRPTSFLLVRF